MNFKGLKWMMYAGILLLTVFTACKKDPIKFNFQKDTANYFSFKNNSQWIYQNTNNASQFDTVLGSAAATGFADRDEGRVEISSITLTGTSSYLMVIRAEAVTNQGVDRIAVLTNFNNVFYPNPVILNIGGNMTVEDKDSIKLLTDLTVGSVTYQNVFEVSLNAHPVYKKLWFAPNVGIIKKKLLDDAIFDLTSYTPGS